MGSVCQPPGLNPSLVVRQIGKFDFLVLSKHQEDALQGCPEDDPTGSWGRERLLNACPLVSPVFCVERKSYRGGDSPRSRLTVSMTFRKNPLRISQNIFRTGI